MTIAEVIVCRDSQCLAFGPAESSLEVPIANPAAASNFLMTADHKPEHLVSSIIRAGAIMIPPAETAIPVFSLGLPRFEILRASGGDQ